MVADYQRPECYDVVETVAGVAADHGVEPAAVALAWLCDRPGVTAPLASARNLSQLRPILEALTLEVSVTRRPGLSPGSPMPRAPDPLWGRPAPTECACPERNGGCIRR